MTKDELLNMQVSWVSSTTSKQVAHQSLRAALAAIRNGEKKQDILRMRAVVKTDHDEYDRIKSTLPANIFAGKFVGGHAVTDIVEYSRLMTLDIDKLNAEQLIKVKQNLTSDPYVFAFWLSPSGIGYKGLVLLDYGDINLEDKKYWHREAFNQLSNYFKGHYEIELDIKCKDVPRLCFVSYDPGLCVKDEIEAFPIEPIEEVKKAKKVAERYRKAFRTYNGTNYRRNEPGRNNQHNRKMMNSIIKYLEKHNISITHSYYEWFSVAMAIVTAFNYDVGENYYLRLCRLDGPRHDEEASRSMLRYCYEHSNFEITLGTLIYFAQCKGYKMAQKAVAIEDTTMDG
ncbi:MAG: hypothetical protein II829_03670 [Bacteroidales bacterium]|nr:MAG: VirE protein [bacterium F082]KWW28632.1 MAG: VirE protein [bacterium P201]MBQ4398669.1 hypothetical protein [Bacteroidales bacterium]